MALKNNHLQLEKAEIWTPSSAGAVIPHSEYFEEDTLKDHFHRSGCAALGVGSVPDPALFSEDRLIEGYVEIERLPIKQAGSDEYRIPAELSRYANTIKAIAEDQHARSLAATFKHAVLYVTRNYVHRNSFQRTPNWHCDDANTVRRFIPDSDNFAPQIPAHIYVVSDCVPTRVQSAPVHNAYTLFGHPQGNQSEQMEKSRLLKPYEIGLLNNYVWHRGTLAETGALRNFLSIMYVPGKAVEEGVPSGRFRRQTLSFD